MRFESISLVLYFPLCCIILDSLFTAQHIIILEQLTTHIVSSPTLIIPSTYFVTQFTNIENSMNNYLTFQWNNKPSIVGSMRT